MMFWPDAIKRFINHPSGQPSWRDFCLDLFWIQAGLISVCWGRWAVHVGIWDPALWTWGHEVEPYDLYLDLWGLGPLFMVARCN